MKRSTTFAYWWLVVFFAVLAAIILFALTLSIVVLIEINPVLSGFVFLGLVIFGVTVWALGEVYKHDQ